MTDPNQPMFSSSRVVPTRDQAAAGVPPAGGPLGYPQIAAAGPIPPTASKAAGRVTTTRRIPPAWIIGAAAVLAIAAVAVGTFAMMQTSAERAAETSASTATVTVDTEPDGATADSGSTQSPVPRTSSASAADVALNVSVPITQPTCDGTGIVVLGNAVVPGKYATEIQQFLNAFPGASYLRTDHSCPSLRQVSDSGTAIYAVYRPAGHTNAEVCAAVRAAGGGAYGKWLDLTTDPKYILPC